MKNIFCLGLSIAFLLGSCNNSSDSEKKAREANEAKIDSQHTSSVAGTNPTSFSKEDADFLVEAAAGGMMEVQLGTTAQTRSVDRGVKDFGALMVKDHSDGGVKLSTLAAGKNITLPDSISSGQEKEKEKLQQKKGEAFDRAYITLMVRDHRKDIREFEKAAKNATDSDIKAFARNNLPMLYMHLDSALSIQKRLHIKDEPEVLPPLK